VQVGLKWVALAMRVVAKTSGGNSFVNVQSNLLLLSLSLDPPCLSVLAQAWPPHAHYSWINGLLLGSPCAVCAGLAV